MESGHVSPSKSILCIQLGGPMCLKTHSALDTGAKAGKLSGTSPQVSQAHFFDVREVNWPKESGWFVLSYHLSTPFMNDTQKTFGEWNLICLKWPNQSFICCEGFSNGLPGRKWFSCSPSSSWCLGTGQRLLVFSHFIQIHSPESCVLASLLAGQESGSGAWEESKETKGGGNVFVSLGGRTVMMQSEERRPCDSF